MENVGFTQILPTWNPRQYQARAVEMMISQACAGLLLPPGMGKTTITYAALKILRAKRLIKRVLVVAPLRVCYNVWPQQKNSWAEFADLKVLVLHGKDKEKTLQDLSADIYCINPEGLKWIEDDPARVKFLKENFDVLVVDESTKFKNTSSQRFKILRKFVKYFRRRYILTGTFTPNGLMDLFGQVYILDEGAALGAYVTHYKNKYFYPTDFMGYNFAPHPWAQEAIATKIAPLTLVLKREDHLDMPELIFHDIEVTLPPAVMAKYRQMEDTLLATVNDEFVIAANAAVATSKCRQIANGGLFKGDLNNPEAWEDLHDEKLNALQDLIEELSGQSLLVVYEFQFDIEKIESRFKDVVRLTTSDPKKDAFNISKFAGGMAKLGAGQFSSISLGLDGLQNSCQHICMYGLTWNLQDYLQTIDRVYRSGQKADTVIIHRIVARGTVDERVLRVLNSKEKTQTDFLDLLKQMGKNRT